MKQSSNTSSKNFMVLSTQRTGSTLFCLWLNSHPSIRCHGEVFLKKSGALDSISFFYRSKGFFNSAIYEMVYNPIAKRLPFNPLLDRMSDCFLDSLLYNHNHSGPWTDPENWHNYHPQDLDASVRSVGFKMMYNTLDNLRWLRRRVLDEKYHIIHLVRENWLKSYVSYMRLQATNQSSVSNSEKVNRKKVLIKTNHMISFFERMQKIQSEYRIYYKANRMLELSYEEFTSDFAVVAEKACNFLEVDLCQMTLPALKKISSGDLRDDIENYDQVEEALVGTEWSVWLK